MNHEEGRDESPASTQHGLTLEQEQERGLLADDYENGISKEEWDEHKETPQKRTAIVWALSGALITLLTLVGLYVLLAIKTRAGSDSPQSSQIIRDNYILDQNWDFKAPSTTREYWFTIRDTVFNPDGVFRPMLLVNQKFPGPLIECNEGDTIVVHVNNQGVNATSLHWHGLYQNGSNWMDGTVGITQCPIAPGGQFTYKFQVKGQSGTYWYHAHQGTQVADGLFGPFIVHSKQVRQHQEIKYDTDRIVMIQDHYHSPASELLMDYLQPDKENAEPVPDGALINGRNIRNCDLLSHRECDNSSASMPTFDLAPRQRHRLRFINTGVFAEFQVQIDEHEFAVIEVDGTDVVPAYYHRLNINPGQRYNIVLSTNVTTADSYWLRARMVTTCFAEPNPDLEPEIRGIVRYDRKVPDINTQTLPQSRDWSDIVELVCRDMNTSDLRPMQPIRAPEKADAFFYLRSNFMIGNWRLSRGFFNDSSWRSDIRSPSLSRVIDGYAQQNRSFTNVSAFSAPTSSLQTSIGDIGINDVAFDINREMVIQTTGIQTIDILIQNFDDGNHPLHLHGYKYFVLGQGHGYLPSDYYATSIDTTNPLRRDTASVEAYGWTLIRLVADNPGMWAFHCHISWHAEAGMLMQFLTRSEVVGAWELPEADRQLCQAEGLERGATPTDEIFFHD
ncbi:hypothetical protein MMC25_003476 [Agyrium rufum]|nr:hypothetical protein [Agyrium rufum]